MIWRLSGLLGLLAVSSGVAAQDKAPSESTKLTRAIEKATAEHKYVVVVVYEDDCADCKRMDNDTLGDPDVASWLGQLAIVVKFNDSTESGRAFTGERGIHDFPALLVFSSGGRELDRSVGFVAASSFKKRMNSMFDSSTISESEPWAGVDVVLAAVERANTDMAKSRYKESLAWYVWCLERRAARWQPFPRLHLPRVIKGFAELAKRFEPAREEFLRQIKIAERDTMRSRPGAAFSFNVIKLGYLALGQENKIVEHYDRIAGSAPNSARQKAFVRFIYEPLLNARRYKDLAWSVEDPDSMIVFMDDARHHNRPPTYVRKVLAARYEVLMGLGRFAAAADMATVWLRYQKSWTTNLALAEAGVRAGVVNDGIANNARLAHSLSGGTDARTAICLSRYLHMVNPEDREAVRILERARKTVKTPIGQDALEEALKEIKKPSPDKPTKGK